MGLLLTSMLDGKATKRIANKTFGWRLNNENDRVDDFQFNSCQKFATSWRHIVL